MNDKSRDFIHNNNHSNPPSIPPRNHVQSEWSLLSRVPPPPPPQRVSREHVMTRDNNNLIELHAFDNNSYFTCSQSVTSQSCRSQNSSPLRGSAHNLNNGVLRNSASEPTFSSIKESKDLMLFHTNNDHNCDRNTHTTVTSESASVLQMFDPLMTSHTSETLHCTTTTTVCPKQSQTVHNTVTVAESDDVTEQSESGSGQESAHNNDCLRALKVCDSEREPMGAEVTHFWARVKHRVRQCSETGGVRQTGFVVSAQVCGVCVDPNLSVKLNISTDLSATVVSFSANIQTSVEHIVCHVICSVIENAQHVQMNEYVLKARHLTEYLSADTQLSDYYLVFSALKTDSELFLELIHLDQVHKPFLRTQDDADHLDSVSAADLIPRTLLFGHISRETVDILLENLEKEIQRLKSEAKQRQSDGLKTSHSVTQLLKAVVSHFSQIESQDFVENVQNFQQLLTAFRKYEKSVNFEKLWEILENALTRIFQSLEKQLNLFSDTFSAGLEFRVSASARTPQTRAGERPLSSSMDTLLVFVGDLCQLKPEFQNYKNFQIRVDLLYGQKVLKSFSTKKTSIESKNSFFPRIAFQQFVQTDFPLFSLPRESRLEFVLLVDNNSADTNGSETVLMFSPFVHLFDFKNRLIKGQKLVSFNTLRNSVLDPKQPLLHISFPETECDVVFPPIRATPTTCERPRVQSLDSATQTELFQLLNKEMCEQWSIGEREQLWQRRHYLVDCAQALSKVLFCCDFWDLKSLPQIYRLIDDWTELSPNQALELLHFPDQYLREKVVEKWLKNRLTFDELIDFLPQMLESLRFERSLNSPIMGYLLESCLQSPRVCHHLFWLLRSNSSSYKCVFGLKMNIYFNALLSICGSGARRVFQRSEKLCELLGASAERVKHVKDSQRFQSVLNESEMIRDFIESEAETVLPLNPSMTVHSLDVKNCSYFASNSVPLKLVFDNGLNVLFKSGDDLRQDMFAIQLIRIFDKIWLKSGLDLRVITFWCICTQTNQGFIQMVDNSETLRRIQQSHGLTGAFKDRPIAEWLQKHNTSELDFYRAVDNFTCSCAAYSVITYLLGICDRHNDNIMLTTSGHLFHIDFGKFLGDSQMMAGIKRDRVPFVLTQDMAYVINGGDKPSKQFQLFVDLCCQAFNLLRKNSNFILSLFSLMTSSQITGLTSDAIKHVHKSLMPHVTDSEAMMCFTRLIEDSLNAFSTQLNFFLHTLSQKRFNDSQNDSQILSFCPKTVQSSQCSPVVAVEVTDVVKQWTDSKADKQKTYFFVLRIQRSDKHRDQQVLRRTFKEFVELQQKLTQLYPLAQFYPLTRVVHPLRSHHTREATLQRLKDVQLFCDSVMLLAAEISQSDIVLTFFHPLLRDQMPALAPPRPLSSLSGQSADRDGLYGPLISGQIKVGLQYQNVCLVVMVMHCKNLWSARSNKEPDAYVKTYLSGDDTKASKRKTKVVQKSSHPTFMQLIVYRGLVLDPNNGHKLLVSVWNYDKLTGNEFLGKTEIALNRETLLGENKDLSGQWFALTSI